MKYSQSNPQLASMFPLFPSVYLQNGSTSPSSLSVMWTVCRTNRCSWGPVWRIRSLLVLVCGKQCILLC